jgi:hypothetical protein
VSNPKINLRKLRQYLSNQFHSVTFQNGETDNFRIPFQELTNSQKHSYIALGNDLADAELKLRLPNFHEVDFVNVPLPILEVIFDRDKLPDYCFECDNKATVIKLDASGMTPLCTDHI